MKSFIMRLRPSDTRERLCYEMAQYPEKRLRLLLFSFSTNWSKLFVLTGTSFVWRSFFLARQTRGGGEQFARVTRDYSSNNFRQLGVRRCKNAPCRVSSDKWPGVGTGYKDTYRGYLNCSCHRQDEDPTYT